jgi:hypothetical protein
MVAAACGARLPPLTVRPVGHPFARVLALSERTWGRLRRSQRRAFAIVDEGPGLSGSSFGAVLRAVSSAGASLDRVHLFPSHLGIGSATTPETRAVLERVPRHCLSFDAVFLGDGPAGLTAWTRELTGGLLDPPEDVGGGRWRRRCCSDVLRWPAANVLGERRKYLLHGRSGLMLAKFAGLSIYGESRRRRGELLAEAGFSPPVLGLRHGFLVQPWLADARPLAEAAGAIARAEMLARVGDYLAFRATMTAAPGRGASPEALFRMAIANVAEDLGAGARALEGAGRMLAALTGCARPVEIDGRLSPWKWLLRADGTLVKVDGVDHCDGHDLVGCQDIAWDVAGASVELALTDAETDRLRRRVRIAGAPVAPEAFAFYRVCYLAFHLGSYRMASRAVAAIDAAEAGRLDTTANRYAALVRALCAGASAREASAEAST